MKAALSVLLTAILFFLPSGSMAGGQPDPGRMRPNIVLITVNALRYSHLGFNGYSEPTSPTLDELAATSFVFTNAFSHSGYTMPAMMSLFTSLYPESHNVMDAYKDRLSHRVVTLAEVLKENGYKTAGFWLTRHPHLDLTAGFGRGFEVVGDLREDFHGRDNVLSWLEQQGNKPFFLVLNSRKTHFPYLPMPRYKKALQVGERGGIFNSEDDYLQTVYGKLIISLKTPGSGLFGAIDTKNMEENPWLFNGDYLKTKMEGIYQLISKDYYQQLGEFHSDVYLERIDINDPLNVSYLRSLYNACILETDQELVKPVVDLLGKMDILDRTIIVFTADHGTELLEHGILGTGTRYYDEMIHVPLFIRIPDLKKRQDIHNYVQAVDLMPTILDLAGIPHPPQMQGRSLFPLMKRSDANIHDRPLFGSNRVRAFMRTGKWKLIVQREDLHYSESVDDELYNLLEDPGERINVREIRQDIYKMLRERVRNHLNSVPRYMVQDLAYPPYIDDATRNKIRETGYW